MFLWFSFLADETAWRSRMLLAGCLASSAVGGGRPHIAGTYIGKWSACLCLWHRPPSGDVSMPLPRKFPLPSLLSTNDASAELAGYGWPIYHAGMQQRMLYMQRVG